MAEEVPDLKRDSTMTVTAKVRRKIESARTGKFFGTRYEWLLFLFFIQEGEQFLEEHGKVHEDAKTRAQQKDLDENEEEEEDAASKLKRTSTMAATAQVRSRVRKLVSFASFRKFRIQKSMRVDFVPVLYIFRREAISLEMKNAVKRDQRPQHWKMWTRKASKMKAAKKMIKKTRKKMATAKRTAQINQLSNAMGQWLWPLRWDYPQFSSRSMFSLLFKKFFR